MRISIIVSIAILLSACGSRHSFSESDFPARQVTIGNKTYGYRIYVPPNRDPNTKIPVMLYLHGSGARGNDNREQIDGFRWMIEPIKDKIDFVAVIPQCERDTFWSSVEMSNYALAALDATVAEFNGDPKRLYLAGFSLGGYGTWQIAAAHPGKFAALVPIAGGVVGERPIDPRDRAVIIPELGTMLDSPEPYKAVAKAIEQTPVWAFHGDADESVPVEFSRQIVQALADAGSTNVKYTEYPHQGHMIVNKAFSEPGLLEWLAKQQLSTATSEKVDVSDDVVYVALLNDLVYQQDRAFGTDLGKLIIIKQDTIVPEDTERLRSFPDLDAALVSDLQEINKTPGKISMRYDTYVPHKATQSKKSLEDIFTASRNGKLPLGGVLAMSRVGFNEDRTVSLVYIEFYNSKKGLMKKYCRVSWKPEDTGFLRNGVTWY